MGILDDLAMGFGLKERDRDYYDRTAATISRNQGSDAGDRYMSGLGDKYKAAPNYSTAIGPSLADFRQVPNTGAGANPYDASGNLRSDYKPGSAAQRYRDVGRPQPGTLPHMLTRSPGILGLLANLFGGYKPIQPQGELRSSYKPMSATAAPAATSQTGAPVTPVAASPLLGYGFEEDKFGFDPQAPRATLDDLDTNLSPGYSQIANGQYVPSYDPFEAQLTPPVDAEFEAWLQTDQGRPYNLPDLPADFVRRAFEKSKRLKAGKF